MAKKLRYMLPVLAIFLLTGLLASPVFAGKIKSKAPTATHNVTPLGSISSQGYANYLVTTDILIPRATISNFEVDYIRTYVSLV